MGMVGLQVTKGGQVVMWGAGRLSSITANTTSAIAATAQGQPMARKQAFSMK